MKREEVEKQIINKVSVTNQMVTYAKAYFLKNFKPDTNNLLNALLEQVEAKMPDKIIIRPSFDADEMVSNAANSISWRRAGCEAIWGLIGSNCLIPGSGDYSEEKISIGFTTGRNTFGMNFNQLSVPVPSKVLMRPSGIKPSEQPLSDPDLFLHELGIEGIDVDIESSLRESVLCFKHELFLGCLALLGRASEGAWIELGKTLAEKIPEGAPSDGLKLKEKMEDQFVGIGKKINTVLKTYERRNIFNYLYKASGYKPVDLKSCVVWSDAVRESRNSIHYGAEPAMSNSYEKVAALLVGAVQVLKVIYSIIGKCHIPKIE